MSTPRPPFGQWPSPITPLSLARALRLRDLAWSADGTLVWLEGRSDRGVLMSLAPGECAPRELTPELSVRARVGYGGGDFTAGLGQIYYAAEGRLYRQPLGAGLPRAVTPAFGDAASPCPSPDGRWLVYVHTYEGQDRLAVAAGEGDAWPQILTEGADFYTRPCWHPGGLRLAWISWHHPNMPWDGTTLALADLAADGQGAPRIAAVRAIAGDADTAVSEPAFSPDGRYLAYISDASGWDDLYLYDLAEDRHHPLVACQADLGTPAWAQGMRSYAWAPDSHAIYYSRSQGGVRTLWRVELDTGHTAPLPGLDEYADFEQPAVSPAGDLAVIASGPRVPPRLLVLPPGGVPRIVARADGEIVPAETFVTPRPISWPSAEGQPVHGLLYTPPGTAAQGGLRPPLIVTVHGGPTGQATARFSPTAQFFASRGYAVLDLNYRGSSGYGRAYRNLLREQWGIYDVDDAVSGARHVANMGLADGDRLVIMGGSAGGYTVLQALVRHPGVFRAGICMYGVSNLFDLAADTHKFEQHYLDSMIGPLPAAAARYRERSPIYHADRIRDAVAVFQGAEDRVVPPAQAEMIVAALRRNGVPHEYHLYPGEGHGWRKSETIETFYHAVLRFLQQHVLFG